VLGGRMRIAAAAARRAIAALGAGPEHREAEAVLRVANTNMERAVRVISVERGYDPRRFTLLAFGGAGPLHACDLAEALTIPRVLVPPSPGVLSAFGMVIADVTRDYVASLLVASEDPVAHSVVTRAWEELERRGRRELAADGFDLAGMALERSLDLRYAGQSYELNVPLGGAERSGWEVAFHAAHEARYGHGHPGRPIEVVNARLRLRLPPPPLAVPPRLREGPLPEPLAIERVWFRSWRPTPIYARETLPAGAQLTGPAVVVQMDATTVVNPDWTVRTDAGGNLLVEYR
jgi:N-methylhydantoinase A